MADDDEGQAHEEPQGPRTVPTKDGPVVAVSPLAADQWDERLWSWDVGA